MKKKILLISTGGTIAMKDGENKGAVPALTGADLVRLVPGLDKLADLEVLEFCNLPSPSIVPEKMFELSQLVSREVEKYDGVVITHGTDVIEETSYLLFLTLSTKKPVIFTAAMRSNEELGLDGPRNLLNAIRVAADPTSYDRGVMLAVNDEIFSVRDVYKSSTHLTNAFDAPNYGMLGMIDHDTVIFFRKPEIREKYTVQRIETSVDFISLCAGMDERYIQTSITTGAKGLVVAAFGRGNVTPAVQRGIKDALAAGLIVVVSSRVPNGRVRGVYGYEGGGRQLEDLGCIMANDLSAVKARLKLMVLLGAGKTREEIIFSFQNENLIQ